MILFYYSLLTLLSFISPYIVVSILLSIDNDDTDIDNDDNYNDSIHINNDGNHSNNC